MSKEQIKVPLNEREKQVFAVLSESSEGEVLVGYCRKLIQALTDTRNLEGDDVNIAVQAANRASGIIEENLIQPLSRFQRHRGEHEPLD